MGHARLRCGSNSWVTDQRYAGVGGNAAELVGGVDANAEYSEGPHILDADDGAQTQPCKCQPPPPCAAPCPGGGTHHITAIT